jgi:hypothetical protein
VKQSVQSKIVVNLYDVSDPNSLSANQMVNAFSRRVAVMTDNVFYDKMTSDLDRHIGIYETERSELVAQSLNLGIYYNCYIFGLYFIHYM